MKKELFEQLQKYDKTFTVLLSAGYIYPMLNWKQRKELLDLYNDLFENSVKVPLSCTDCIKPYLKDLAKRYIKEKKEFEAIQKDEDVKEVSAVASKEKEVEESNEDITFENKDAKGLKEVKVGRKKKEESKSSESGSKRGRKPKTETFEEAIEKEEKKATEEIVEEVKEEVQPSLAVELDSKSCDEVKTGCQSPDGVCCGKHEGEPHVCQCSDKQKEVDDMMAKAQEYLQANGMVQEEAKEEEKVEESIQNNEEEKKQDETIEEIQTIENISLC